jgi:hypothetical protein
MKKANYRAVTPPHHMVAVHCQGGSVAVSHALNLCRPKSTFSRNIVKNVYALPSLYAAR